MKPLISACILAGTLTLIMAACSSAQVDRQAILSAYSGIDVADGVDENEMKVIAQHFLLTTSVEPCKSDLSHIKINRPHVRCGWILPEKQDQGCYVGFSKKGLFEVIPLFVKVSSVTGEASCAGYLILK